jgi:hypothetical protein
MLFIEREGQTRNAHLIVLAQGDNQEITTFYKKGTLLTPRTCMMMQ